MTTTSCSSGAEEVPIGAGVRAAIMSLGSSNVDLQQAELRLQDKCLKAHGYVVPGLVTQTVGALSVNLSGALGLLTVEGARAAGYGPLIGQSSTAIDPVGAFVQSLSERDGKHFSVAYNGGEGAKEESLRIGRMVAGASTEGCVALARIRIYGSISNFLRLTYLPGEIVSIGPEVVNSPAANDAFRGYADCMKKAGLDVDNLNQARQLATERFGSRQAMAPPTAEEVSMAVTDANCQVSSGLRDRLNDETLRRASAYIAAHEEELLALQELLTTARINAKAALGGLGS
ncbi:MAG: hypothetical protein WAR57_09700 [Candidatus Phosphoribacter sp.]|nr:hypothetical protein [Actinomycetales bacterium]